MKRTAMFVLAMMLMFFAFCACGYAAEQTREISGVFAVVGWGEFRYAANGWYSIYNMRPIVTFSGHSFSQIMYVCFQAPGALGLGGSGKPNPGYLQDNLRWLIDGDFVAIEIGEDKFFDGCDQFSRGTSGGAKKGSHPVLKSRAHEGSYLITGNEIQFKYPSGRITAFSFSRSGNQMQIGNARYVQIDKIP